MKNFNILAKCLLIALILINLQTKTVMAQFIPPNTPDISATQTAAVIAARNTGNDIMEFEFGTGDEMRVSVWDDNISNAAAFSWEETATNNTGHQILDGTNYGIVSDPDIILSVEGYQVFIVYELLINATDIFYESWRYNPGTNSWGLIFGATQLNTASPASNPNIDGINVQDFEMAAVWEQDGEIWTIPGDVNGFGSYSPVFLDHTSAPAMWPDVSLYYNPSTGRITVNFTYLQDVSTAWVLWHQREDINDLQNGVVIPNITGRDIKSPGELGRPRIASNNMWDDDDSNYAIAIRYWDIGNDEYYIYTYTECAFTLYGPNIINDNSPDLTLAGSGCFINDEPAIAYAHDLLLVVWTYEDACWGYLNGNKDIIQKRCNICDGTSATTEYLHVNSTADDDEIAPSVASRHSPSSFYNALYTYSDPANTNDVYYVTSYFANSPIQIAGGNKSVRVIVKPNPTSDKLEVKSDSDQKIYLIKLIDMQSKIFIEETVNALEKSIDVSSIKNGIYLLTLDFEDGSKVNYKVIISH